MNPLHHSIAKTAEARALLYKGEAKTFEDRFQRAIDLCFASGQWPDGEPSHRVLLDGMRSARLRSQREMGTSEVLHPRPVHGII
jgi:hypothetical protein